MSGPRVPPCRWCDRCFKRFAPHGKAEHLCAKCVEEQSWSAKCERWAALLVDSGALSPEASRALLDYLEHPTLPAGHDEQIQRADETYRQLRSDATANDLFPEKETP